MVLKGLQLYDISDEDGEIVVWSFRKKRKLKTVYHPRRGYRLEVNGKFLFFTYGHLRFLMKHPEIHAETITPHSHNITFEEDGSVRNFQPSTENRRYTVFKSLEDALNTILLLLSVQDGNEIPIEEFVAEQREAACYRVSRLLNYSARKVAYYLEGAEKQFYKEIAEVRVEKIQPLFAWFCKCLKTEVIKGCGRISIDKRNLDNTLILQKH